MRAKPITKLGNILPRGGGEGLRRNPVRRRHNLDRTREGVYTSIRQVEVHRELIISKVELQKMLVVA